MARRRLLSEARELHADQMVRVRAIDEVIESLVDERLACLDVLVDCRDQLRPRWGRRHSRRRSSVDEAPFPEATNEARPVEGVGLRSVALTILRRHGPQRLRDLHGLIHLYGYRIESVRPVQRLGDAMAYELRQGRVVRLERGVYEAVEPHPGPTRYVPPTVALDDILPWDRPITDPGPPHIDPDVATDPELWSSAAWPTEGDVPAEPGDEPVSGPEPVPGPEPMHEGAADREAAGRQREPDPAPECPTAPDPAAPTSEPLGGDSSTNRRPRLPEQSRPWAPPP